jgi:hypothetical protein
MFPSAQKLLTSLSGAFQFLIATSGPQSAALPGKFGTFTLTAATPLDVADTAVTANSMILIGLLTPGGTVGAIPAVQTKTAGVGFNVVGTASDTSIYTYLILG